MARGGKRTGAGRPIGTPNKRLVTDYWTEEEVKTFVEFGKDRYTDSDKVYIELHQHLFGKPAQPVEGDFKATLSLVFDPTFNAPTRKTEGDSKK
jgi:hypothetical protein